MSRLLMLALALTAVLLGQGCGRPAFRVSETRTHTEMHIADAPLQVEGRNGHVQIVCDPEASEVDVTAVITCGGSTSGAANQRLADTHVSIGRDTSGTLIIRPVFAGGAQPGDAARFTIRLPDARDVDVRTSNGRVSVAGTSGTLDIGTSNGPVGVEDHAGPAVVRTSNAPVTLANVAGEARVGTSNGRIDVSLRPDVTGPVRLHTSNGRINLTVGPAFRGAVSMRTSNGRVQVDDPHGYVAERNLQRSSGRVVLGEGGAASDLRTSNGRIRVRVVAAEAEEP